MGSNAQVMTVSRNGQVSIPADVRSRWNTMRVIVVDLGDRIVMRPLVDAPIGDLEGIYAGRGADTAAARVAERAGDRARERAR